MGGKYVWKKKEYFFLFAKAKHVVRHKGMAYASNSLQAGWNGLGSL